eukprot:3528351-Prymnesium_polylepis.1
MATRRSTLSRRSRMASRRACRQTSGGGSCTAGGCSRSAPTCSGGGWPRGTPSRPPRSASSRSATPAASSTPAGCRRCAQPSTGASCRAACDSLWGAGSEWQRVARPGWTATPGRGPSIPSPFATRRSCVALVTCVAPVPRAEREEPRQEQAGAWQCGSSDNE